MTTTPRPRRALAALAVTGLLLTGCGDERPAASAPVPPVTPAAASLPGTPTPAPAEPAEPAGLTEVPDGFPLAAGLPATNGDDDTPVEVTDRPTWTEVRLCGEVAWSREAPVALRDLAGASYTGEAENVRSRVLAVYADAPTATAALDVLRDRYAACGIEEVGGTDQVYEVVSSAADAVTVAHRFRGDAGFDTGLEVVQLRTVGNALFLGSYYAEANGGPGSVDSFARFAERSSQPVWDAMAVFADDAPAAPAAADVPLGAGWPARVEPGEAGTVLPVTDSEPDVERDFGRWVCGTPAPEADGDVLRARFADVEDHRARRLVVLDDAEQAVAHVDRLRAFYADCPARVEVVDTAVGGQSFGVTRFTEGPGGEPAVGLMALHVVRVGRSVLLDAVSSEGSAGTRGVEAAARDQLADMARASAAVVAAQCAFTEASC